MRGSDLNIYRGDISDRRRGDVPVQTLVGIVEAAGGGVSLEQPPIADRLFDQKSDRALNILIKPQPEPETLGTLS